MEKIIPTYLLIIDEELSSELQVDYVAMVDEPAIERNFLQFSSDVNVDVTCIGCGHNWNTSDSDDDDEYICHICGFDNTLRTEDGELYTGPTHKDANGRLMTGEEHTEDSEYLYYKDYFAEIGPKGGVRKSDKAPKSKTKNENPKGEGSAKGNASGKKGAEVTQEQEKTLQKKVDDFNEKESNTKNGRATLGALKSVFQRGIGAYNTSHSPEVKSSEQWAYARCNAFLYLLKNGRPENKKYTTDYDLLPKDHPKSKEKMSEQFAETYNDYPEQASENAKIALRYVEEYGWGDCGEDTGKKRASMLANRENLSRDTIARMASFERHRQNSQKELGDGCGRLMWLCWGGDAGIEWAQRKLKQIDKEKFSIKLSFKINEVNEDKQEIFGPAMLADVPIYRNDKQLGQYNVVFDKATIYKIAQKFFEKDFNKNFNLMHDPNQKCTGVYAFQSYIVDSAEGRPAPKGYEDAKDGSWFLGVKVNNAEVWSKIKSGEIKGFSVEGVFEYKKKELTSEQIYREIEQLLKELDS